MDWFLSLPVFLQALLASLFTYGMTALGGTVVFFAAKLPKRFLTLMTGCAAGIMIAASFFSLLLPALEYDTPLPSWAVVSFGFCLGGLFIAFSDIFLEKIQGKTALSGALLVFSVTLHNIPEGMAIGVAFGAAAGLEEGVASALSLAIGIGLQNFPEGMCVAFPLRAAGSSSKKSFLVAQFSGFVEIVACLFGVIFVLFCTALLPWVLAFSAGAMVAVVCSELIPTCFSENKLLSSVSVVLGFTLMMLLDTALG